jgi:hypothetical protein
VPATPQLPAWAEELALAYESGAHGQFILYGNVHDRFVLGDRLLNLYHYLQQALLGDFAVLCGYDQGNGLRVERGGEHLARWQREQGLDE